MIKRALISIFDKTDLGILLRKLDGYELIATGSSAIAIKQLGYEVIEVKDVTSFDEILNGRVKTLHPNIFGGILSTRSQEDNKTINKYNIKNIDVVVCNLYPFYETVSNNESLQQDIIENIDIGGVSLIRAGAKNYQHVSVLVDPSDYKNFDPSNNFEYAKKAFYITSNYDKMIFEYFNSDSINDSNYYNVTKLSYGENRHQDAKFLHNGEVFEQLNGKELSYNNMLDIEIASSLTFEFNNTCCSGVKHNTPCGVGFGNDAYSSYVDCFQCDKESIFGGIVSFNTIVDEKCAKELVKIFLEVVIAHDFTLGALELLKEKKNLRVIKISSKPNCKVEVKSALGGVLVQKKDCNILDDEQLDVVCGSVDDIDIKRLVSLQKVAKYVKSNAIVLGIEDKVVGIAGGQTSRVEALKQAITKMNNRGIKGDVYLASDAFFPFSDSIEIASGCNVKYIIQPGGSIKDDEVIEKCNEKKINMILTGVRHFKH